MYAFAAGVFGGAIKEASEMKKTIGRWLCAVGVAVAAIGLCRPAGALEIVQTFNWGKTHQYYDIHGVNRTGDLIAIMNYAASFWEDIILDDHTLQIEYYWDDIDATGMNTPLVYDDDGRLIECLVRVDTKFAVAGGGTAPHNFYFDPAPADNVEYDMAPTMFHQLPWTTQTQWYNGIAPDGLEVMYHGNPAATAGPEVDGTDLLTLLLHEVGHALGIGGRTWEAETEDGDYDLNPGWIGGNTAAVNCYDPVHNRVHIIPSEALMYPWIHGKVRRLPSATDVLAQASASGWTHLNIPRRHFLEGTDYNAPGNWILGELPDADDDVYVCAPSSGTVTMSANASARNLHVAEWASLSTGPRRLDVLDTITLGSGGRDMATLTVASGGWVTTLNLLLQSGTVEVNGSTFDVANILQCWDPDGGPGTLRASNGGLIRADILSLGGSGYTVTFATEGGGLRINQLSNPQDSVEMAGALEFGHAFGSFGNRQHTVSAGQSLRVGGWFTVGHDAEATVTVSGGGRIESGRLDIGVYDIPGHVVVTGLNSRWENVGDVTAGLWGTGEVNVSDEGYLGCEDAYIGLEAIGGGSATVSGPYSLWNCTAGMHVGFHGTGTLDIADGGNVRNAHGVIGYWPDGEGEVTVGGLGATWANHTSLYVGGSPGAPGGVGTLTVNAGGTVDVVQTVKIWGPGSVDVTGTGALLIADQVVVERSAGGSLTIGAGGTLRTNGLTGLGISTSLGGNLQIGHVGGSGSGNHDVPPEYTLTVGKELSVGYNADGRLTIQAGGSARSGGTGATSYIGHESDANGEAIVHGTWVCGGALRVGHRGTGTLEVGPTGRVTSRDATVGHGVNGKGTVRVDGAGATWDNAAGLQLGNSGVGIMAVTLGGKVTTAWANLGRYPDADGQATIDGEGSDWTSTGGTFYIGHEGFGALTVTDGGSVHADLVHVAHIPTSTAILTVQDPCSKAVFTGDFHVGHAGTGYADVSGGGRLSTPMATIGDQPIGCGAVAVRGGGSRWVNAGGLQVARYGAGELSIHSQGHVETAWVNLGRNVDSNGVAVVEDTGSLWKSTGTFHVGYEGAGSVTVRDGGQLETTSGCIARNPGSWGEAVVEGSGSRWANSGSLWLGGHEFAAGGTGRLTVRDGAEVDIAGNMHLWAGGTADFSGGVMRVDRLAMSNGPGGEFHWTGGTLCARSVSGHLVNNGGTLAPGRSIGFTDVDGSYAQASLGTLQIDISGSDNSDPLTPDYDAVHVTSGVDLAGTLELNWFPMTADPNSRFGGPYDVITYSGAGGFAGGFDAFTGTIDDSYVAGVNYASPLGDGVYAVRVTLHDVLAGDCDLDGDVDDSDLAAIEAGLNRADAEWPDGDMTFDGAVDHLDYLVWKDNAGAAVPGALPEPATVTLIALGALALAGRRRRRRIDNAA